jgi:hypothetical protein
MRKIIIDRICDLSKIRNRQVLDEVREADGA